MDLLEKLIQVGFSTESEGGYPSETEIEKHISEEGDLHSIGTKGTVLLSKKISEKEFSIAIKEGLKPPYPTHMYLVQFGEHTTIVSNIKIKKCE